MDTMNSIAAREHQRDLHRNAERPHPPPRTQVRRWVQLKHVFGSHEERWGTSRAAREPACATC